MAVKPKKKSSKQVAHEEIIQRGLVAYSREAMTIFGKYTLEQRAIPDFRDGLKPVHRRILWSAHQLGLSAAKKNLMKSARIVGDAMGKYHPHGDKAVYDSQVGMVHQRQGLIHGSGNFGTLIEGPAAMRYTEARLTDYSDAVFLDPTYLSVADYALNYDGSLQEPVILPSCLPNLLLNGIFGIATGGRTSIPAFHPDGVLKLAKKCVTKDAVTIKDCVKHLIPVTTLREGGSSYLEEKEYVKELERFFKTGVGSVYWVPETEHNIKDRSITVSGFAPQVTANLSNIISKLAADDAVEVEDRSDIDDSGNSTQSCYYIKLKKSVPNNEVEDTLIWVQEQFETSQSLMFAVNERSLNDKQETDVTFEVANMVDFFKRWGTWRISLERKAIKYQIEQLERKLFRDETLALAVSKLDVIFKALKLADTEGYIKKNLKLNDEQLAIIMAMTVRQLKKLEGDALNQRIKDTKAEVKRLKAEHKDPVSRIHKVMDKAAQTLK